MKVDRKILLPGIFFLLLIFYSCQQEQKKSTYDEAVSGTLSVAYPEQMMVSMDKVIRDFTKEYPMINIYKKVLSGVDDVRELAQNKDSCDLLVYDDYKLIELFLIPDHTRWTIKFARDEIVIAYTDSSKYKDDINSSDWYKVLLKPDVSFGRIDPFEKTCGYRTLSTFKLAGKYYNAPNLTFDLVSKDNDLIYKNITQLSEALDNHSIDYAFMFKSMAITTDFPFIEIPKIMNLNHPDLFSYYAKVNVPVMDKDSINSYPMQGAPVIYGLSIMDHSRNMNNALIFSEYMLSKDKGLAIITEAGIVPMIPSNSFYYKLLPESLKKFNRE